MPDNAPDDAPNLADEFPVDDANSNAKIDAANRLERHLDEQLTSLQRIDDKAEHITRLLGILLGLVFTALSVVSQFAGTDSGERSTAIAQFESVAVPTEVAFLVGVALLLLSLFASVLTYLSSVVRRGLHPNVGHLLSNDSYETDVDEHIRRVLGTYGYNIQENHRVVMTNARRLRMTLLLLLLGVFYLSTSGVMFLGIHPTGSRWYILGGVVVLSVATTWYVWSGKFLTLNPLTSDNE